MGCLGRVIGLLLLLLLGGMVVEQSRSSPAQWLEVAVVPDWLWIPIFFLLTPLFLWTLMELVDSYGRETVDRKTHERRHYTLGAERPYIKNEYLDFALSITWGVMSLPVVLCLVIVFIPARLLGKKTTFGDSLWTLFEHLKHLRYLSLATVALLILSLVLLNFLEPLTGDYLSVTTAVVLPPLIIATGISAGYFD